MIKLEDQKDFFDIAQSISEHNFNSSLSRIQKINYKKIRFKKVDFLKPLNDNLITEHLSSLSNYDSDSSLLDTTQLNVNPLRKKQSSTSEMLPLVHDIEAIEDNEDNQDLENSLYPVSEMDHKLPNDSLSGVENVEMVESFKPVQPVEFVWPPKIKRQNLQDLKVISKSKKPYFIADVKPDIRLDLGNVKQSLQNEILKTPAESFPWESSVDGYEKLDEIFGTNLESQLVDTEDVELDNIQFNPELRNVFVHKEIQPSVPVIEETSPVTVVIRALKPNLPNN